MRARNHYLILTKIKELDEKITKSGIVIPGIEEGRDNTAWAEIYECEDRSDQKYKKGDCVIFTKYVPVFFVLDEVEYWVVKEQDIICIV